MQDYKKMYNGLKDEYERYQIFVEKNVQELSEKITRLERDIDSLTNIVEISKYINKFFSNDNLISLINDMIIGILGVTYSTIFLTENNELIVKSSNINDMEIELTSEEINSINSQKEFIINSKKTIKSLEKNKIDIHSIMGVPIKLGDKFIGYIMVEHYIYNFMNRELQLFLQSIANQIAIVIENSFLYKKLELAAQTDALIGIYSRKYFFEFMSKKLVETNINDFAIVMVDVDDFKKINDTYGHQFGDNVLVNCASILRVWLEKGDTLARYGGEEFIIYIDNVKAPESVYNKFEIVRKSIQDSIVNFEGKTKAVTASFGIAYYPRNGHKINEIISLADKLLYKAKNGGKNRVLSSHIF